MLRIHALYVVRAPFYNFGLVGLFFVVVSLTGKLIHVDVAQFAKERVREKGRIKANIGIKE